MIKAIFIVINGAYAFSRQYTDLVDPHLLSGLLTAFRVSSKEFATGDFRQATFDGSEVFVDGLTERPNDFVAIFATPDERRGDLTNLMGLVKTAFIGRYGERIHSWNSLEGPFHEFEPTIDQIIAGCVWCDTDEPKEAPKIGFSYELEPSKETVYRGDSVKVNYHIRNSDKKSIRLTAITNAIPELFSIQGLTKQVVLRNTIFLRNQDLKREEYFRTSIEMKARRIGHTNLAPVLFISQGSKTFTILGQNWELDII